MRNLIATLIATSCVACASAPPPAPGPYAPAGSVPGVMDETRPPPAPGKFASRPDCDKLVDHLDSVIMLSGTQKNIFQARNQTPDWHRARVDECTVTVDQSDRDCLFGSHDLSTAERCGSRFFADTLRAYHFR
jgi:hypothetical protein